jgi:hypothetical protein
MWRRWTWLGLHSALGWRDHMLLSGLAQDSAGPSQVVHTTALLHAL